MKILSICGSPRKGNSEAILRKLKEMFERLGAENEIILLREKNIERCDGCVECCNRTLKCRKKDGMVGIIEKMKKANGFVFISPNYFKMPSGLFKDFIDRCSVFYTKSCSNGKSEVTGKKAIVIAVGADETKAIDVCLKNMSDNFCKTLGMKVVAAKSFRSRSELKGKYNDIFENGMNKNIVKTLDGMAKKLVK